MTSSLSFTKRLNQCLDDIDAPKNVRERANLLSKMLDIPKQDAWALLDGQQRPDQAMLEKIANEFEVKVEWLLGD